MPKVVIKDDLHTSEQNFGEFQKLKENFDVTLAEISRNSKISKQDFNGLTGFLFYISLRLFFATFGKGQRNSKTEISVKPLDLEFYEMPKHLTWLDRIKLYSIIALYGLIGLPILLLDPNIFSIVIGIFYFSMCFFLYFISFILLIDRQREKHMAEVIESEVNSGNSVLAYLGAAHARPVKKRLEEKGIEVERKSLGRWKPVVDVISVVFNMLRPISFVKKGY